MNKPQAQLKEKISLGLSTKDIQSILLSASKEEILGVLALAKSSRENIRAREDVYIGKVPDEILKKPFEIVK